MGLLQGLADLFGGTTLLNGAPPPDVKQEAKGLFDSATAQDAGGLLAGVFPYGTPPKRGTRELIQTYKRHPWLRTVVHRIAHDCACVPYRLWAPAKGKTPSKAMAIKHAQGPVRKNLLDHAVQSGELREIEQHPFLDLLHTMNPAMRGFASRMVTQIYVELSGETFWVLEQNGLKQAIEAWPVPPHWCIMTPAWKMPWFRMSWMGWNRQIPEDEVHWIKEPDPENPYWRGTGLGNALGDEIDIDLFTVQHLKSWYYNRALPDAIISVEGLTDVEEAKKYEEAIRQKHQGFQKGGQIHVANGKVTVEQLQQTFRESQMTETRNLQRDTLLQTFNIPPELVGVIENSNRATIDSAYFLYAAGVLCPRLDFMCDQLQPLLDRWDDRLILDYVSPVPEDHEFKKSAYVAAPWAHSKNEWRALAGDQPLPGGDDEFPPMPGGGGLPGDDTEEPEPSPGEPAAGEDDAEDKRVGAAVRKGATAEVLDALRPDRLTDETSGPFADHLKVWGQRVLNELGVSLSFDMKNPLVRHRIDALAGTKIHHINRTTRDALRSTLAEGAAAGEGIEQLAKRVGDVFDAAEGYRAEMIARTEVVGASNAANVAAYTMSGVVQGKEWLAVQDGETRDTHKSLDGQQRRLGEMFVADNGDSAEYPGAFHDAGEDINCRCSCLPVTEMSDKAARKDRAGTHSTHEKSRGPWAEAMREAFVRGFKRQRADVLKALRG